MAPGRYEYRDFDVGHVPRYAQREAAADADPAADFAAYGNEPDELRGASSQVNSNELQDPGAEQGAEDDLVESGPAWLKFGDLAEDDPEQADNLAAAETPADDEDLLDDPVVIPAQSVPADTAAEGAAGSTEDREPADDAAAEDDASPEAVETVDRRFEDETADPDEAAAIIAEEFGLDIEEARRLVAEAQATMDAETTVGPGEPDDADDGPAPDGSAPGEDDDEAESTDGTTPKDRVVTFLRRVASKTGEITSNEAAIFAEGARALGEDFREWYATRDERGRDRALARARKDVAKGVRKWDKFETHRGRTGVRAPRGDEDR